MRLLIRERRVYHTPMILSLWDKLSSHSQIYSLYVSFRYTGIDWYNCLAEVRFL